MVMYRGVWWCMGVYSDVQEYMVLYRGVWLCMECMVMFRDVC